MPLTLSSRSGNVCPDIVTLFIITSLEKWQMSVNSCKINKNFFRNISELWIYVTIWMNLQSLKLNERRHAQKTAYSMIPIILYFHYGIGTNVGKGLNVCWGLIIEGSNWQKNPQENFWGCWEYSTYYFMVVVVIIHLNCTFNIFDLKKWKDTSMRAPTMRRMQ